MNEQNISQGNAGTGDSATWAKSFAEFWPLYLSQHSNPRTRQWHYAGTLVALLCAFFVFGNYLASSSLIESLLMAVFTLLVVSYGLLFTSHWVVEGNQPTTVQAFGKPKGQIAKELWWSVRGDFKLLCLALRESVADEYRKHNLQ